MNTLISNTTFVEVLETSILVVKYVACPLFSVFVNVFMRQSAVDVAISKSLVKQTLK